MRDLGDLTSMTEPSELYSAARTDFCKVEQPE